jgi:predicted MFS family arabinose efflux permease
MASQSLLVVLSPAIVAVAADLGASVGAVGQARSITAAVAIVASIVLTARVDAIGVRRLLRLGAALAIAASAGVAAAPTLRAFLAAHVLVGVALASLVSAGFAGVAAFAPQQRSWAIGHVAGANALAWIVVNPLAGALTENFSWRAAHAVPAVMALAVLAGVRAAPAAHATAGAGLRVVLADSSARRWILAEMMSFYAWGTYLTFIGAYFVQAYAVGESATGIVLALGAAAFFVASVRGAPLVGRLPRPRVVAVTVLVMAALITLQFEVNDFVWMGLLTFFLSGAAGGIRSAVASALGLAQLPGQPGTMMAARTAANQTGYLLGGLIGGATLALGGYAAMGIVLATGLVICAALIVRVTDPLASREARGAGR